PACRSLRGRSPSEPSDLRECSRIIGRFVRGDNGSSERMSRGRHARRRFLPRGRWAVVALLAGGLVVLAGGSAFAAYRYDRSTVDELLSGVSIAGVNVGGMTRHQALHAVKSQVQVSLSNQLDVRAGDHEWKVAPRDLG